MKTETKELILALITTLKLTGNEINSLENEAAKWKNRMELARSKGMEDLFSEAEKEAERINKKLSALLAEKEDLKNQIEGMRRQIPSLAADGRSIDTDLLEQELLMLLGKTGEESKTDIAFREMEKSSAADAALEALKVKIKADTVKEG